MEDGALPPETSLGTARDSSMDLDFMDELFLGGCWLETTDGSEFLLQSPSNSGSVFDPSYLWPTFGSNNVDLTANNIQEERQRSNFPGNAVESIDKTQSLSQGMTNVAGSPVQSENYLMDDVELSRRWWIRPKSNLGPSSTVMERLIRALGGLPIIFLSYYAHITTIDMPSGKKGITRGDRMNIFLVLELDFFSLPILLILWVISVKRSNCDATSEQEEEGMESNMTSKSQSKAREHMKELERLQEKDPEFYQFLKEHDKELLEFNDEDIDEDDEIDMENAEIPEDDEADASDLERVASKAENEDKSSEKVITTAMVDSWCNSIRENTKLSAIRSLMRAFRTACHYGDDEQDESLKKFNIMSSSVFNKIMLFVLSEMDGILRSLLKLPTSGGKKETIIDLMGTKQWKDYNHLVKSYLGNALHILNQMTDTEMVSFTLRRLRYSSIFLSAFPSLLRKYIKVAIHFWGTGGGALPVVSFLFIRDLCIRLGSDHLDECFKGIYKAYVLNCQFVNAVKLQHIQFLGNCVIELLGVDLPIAYQHAFVFIRQLGMILREALNMRTKEAFRKVYEWKFINCLELWTGAICAYGSEADFRPLAYPLTQIISGVARLVPTARYFPLRLRCARMLNRIAASTGTFIPVSLLLLDMLEMKELNRPPTGGAGKAVDLRSVLKVSKPTLKTRAFQEACVLSVVEELAEHLAQWSYSVAFLELSFIPAVRLRSFCKATKIERFRREMRQLIHNIQVNSEFTNERRMRISFLPNDPAATTFLEDEKKSGASPLSQYVATLHQRAQQRNESLMGSSVLVGSHSSIFGNKMSEHDEEDDTANEDGAAVFNSSWFPGSDSKANKSKEGKKKKKKKMQEKQEEAITDDVVEDLILSSDEDGSLNDTSSAEEEDEEVKSVPSKQQLKKQSTIDMPSSGNKDKAKPTLPKKKSKKRKPSTELSKKDTQFHKKSKKRTRTN